MSDTEVADLARAAGLMVEWRSASGEAKTVTPDALRPILQAMDLPCDTPAEIRDSKARIEAEHAAPPVMMTGDSGMALDLPGVEAGGRARLLLENGETREFTLEGIHGGARLPAIDTPGYHQLEIADRSVQIAIAPARCWGIADAAPGRRIWGTAAQVYALHEREGTGFGDFGALAGFARTMGDKGADAIAISPVHALFPADAQRYSPYAPSSRLFLNALLADPTLLGAPVTDEEAPSLIDWQAAIPARLTELRVLFDALAGSDDLAVRNSVDAFRGASGPDLALHATFDALHAHFHVQGRTGGWQAWPAPFHDPHGEAVARFVRENPQEIAFHVFLQWLADKSLGTAQQAARDSGMAVGLIADLAVGMDAGGSHAWSRRGDLLNGLSVGAPPDIFQPTGQDWGIQSFAPGALRRTGYAPFLATLQAAMAHAGGVRIDHAMGLRRLWVVPHGASPRDGAYLTYPLDDMLRLIALESQRHQAIVIAEDLGTVPEGFREALDARGILGMRVLWFERTGDGGFTPPAHWSQAAAAMTTTHDLPTVAGWWSGHDIDWTFKLGRRSNFDNAADAQADRAEDRTRLWSACRDAGTTDGDPPPVDQPEEAVDPVVALVASTPCALAILPVEDLLGMTEQPNMPGTIDEHPNWRRRLPAPAAQLFAEPAVAARIAHISATRDA